MKKTSVAILSVCLIIAVAFSFFIGSYMSDKKHMEDKAKQCSHYIAFAIDTAESKGFSVDGALEATASNLWVAHELCEYPELSAELNHLWNSLVYDRDTYIGQEEPFILQLKDILKKYEGLHETASFHSLLQSLLLLRQPSQ